MPSRRHGAQETVSLPKAAALVDKMKSTVGARSHCRYNKPSESTRQTISHSHALRRAGQDQIPSPAQPPCSSHKAAHRGSEANPTAAPLGVPSQRLPEFLERTSEGTPQPGWWGK
ncbi:hypothetical protein RND81_05G005200 [Saponaria officinalis]|uniref:Uncharacterized protein n=1 Tax=Saponaria officinalis TaxID=3572 RepID=A0AAW1KT23_SAPOF